MQTLGGAFKQVEKSSYTTTHVVEMARKTWLTYCKLS